MNFQISSASRQALELKIKANLAVVYPNALPDVLDTEVRMIESKAYATATSRGNYVINVLSYIATHKLRTDGAQCLHRIPKLTRQEENARREKVRESINAGDQEMAQNALQNHHAKASSRANPSGLPHFAPVATEIGASSQPLHTQVRSSRPSSGIASAQLDQPASKSGTPSNRRFSRSVLPQARSFVHHKSMEVTAALEKEKLRALEEHQEKVLKDQRDNAMRARQTQVQGAALSQKPQSLPQQGQNANALYARQAQSLHSLQLHSQKSHSLKPPSTHPQPQHPIALRAQDPSLEQQNSQMARNGTQIQSVNEKRIDEQSKSRIQDNNRAIAQDPTHPQVPAPPVAKAISQTRSPRLADAVDQPRTIEQTKSISQINKSNKNTDRPPVQTSLRNQALPGMAPVRSLQNNFQPQNVVQNHPLLETSSVLQVEPMSQPKLSSEIPGDEELEKLSSDQLLSVLKKTSDPCRLNLQATAEVQNGKAETLPNHTSGNSISQLSAVPHSGEGSGLLTPGQALQQALFPGLHPPMASADDKKNENAPSDRPQRKGVPLQHGGSRVQGLPLQITRDQAETLRSDQNGGQVSSVQENVAGKTKVFPASAPQQQAISKPTPPTFPIPKQYGESSTAYPARAAVTLDDDRRNSKNSSVIPPTQQRETRQAAGQPEASSHANPVPTSKFKEVTHNIPTQSSGPPLPTSTERQVLLAKWVKFQRDYRTRLDRFFPILETLFANPTEDEKRILKNVQTIRTVLHKNTTSIAENQTANSSYHTYLTFVCRVFQKYSKYERMSTAELKKEARSLKPSARESISERPPMGNSQATQKTSLNDISNSAMQEPADDIGGQTRSSQENMEVSAEQGKDMSVPTRQEKFALDAVGQDQRPLPTSQLINRPPDPKRVDAIVKGHIRRNVEKHMRESIPSATSSDTNAKQKELTDQKMNDRAKPANVQASTAVNTTENPVAAPSSRVNDKNVLPVTKAAAATVATGNDSTKTSIPVTSGDANTVNRSTDSQKESRRNPTHGNVSSQPADVDMIEMPAQHIEEDAANSSNQEKIDESTGIIEQTNETSQAAHVLLEKMKQSICRFQTAVDEDPVLNGSVRIESNDNRTDEEALSDLVDRFDGKSSKKRSAIVEETLKDLDCDEEGSEEGKKMNLEPVAKKRKTLSLREQLEFDCARIHKSNDSVKCVIQEVDDTLVVTCTVNMGDDEIPILKMKVLEGYPSRGKVHYNVETPKSGWQPSFDVMKSRFEESMSPEAVDYSLGVVVGKWFTAVVHTVLTFD